MYLRIVLTALVGTRPPPRIIIIISYYCLYILPFLTGRSMDVGHVRKRGGQMSRAPHWTKQGVVYFRKQHNMSCYHFYEYVCVFYYYYRRCYASTRQWKSLLDVIRFFREESPRRPVLFIIIIVFLFPLSTRFCLFSDTSRPLRHVWKKYSRVRVYGCSVRIAFIFTR